MNFDDLMALAAQEEIVVIRLPELPTGLCIPAGVLPEYPDSTAMILLPMKGKRQHLSEILAHELGHLLQGHRVGLKPRLLLEIEANHWAKEALRAPALAGPRQPTRTLHHSNGSIYVWPTTLSFGGEFAQAV